MAEYQSIILIYILFIWCVLLHTFEEISQGIIGIKIGPIKMTNRKYLIGASVITTVNLATLSLLVIGHKLGLFIGIFTATTIGILQAVVHAIGFIKAGRKANQLGAGFYSSIPLSFVGILLLMTILHKL